MKSLVIPTAAAFILALSGSAWGQCIKSQDRQSTAEAPIEQPAEKPSS